jgi:hypothetical protein
MEVFKLTLTSRNIKRMKQRFRMFRRGNYFWSHDGQTGRQETLHNCVDVMREAKAMLVAAAQSSTSFIPPLGEEKAQVLTLNLRNRMIFKGADEAGAVESADFLGQRKVRQRTSGYSGGMLTRSYTNVDEHKIKPYELRNLRKHQCVLVHCEKGFHKTVLPPIEPDGTISKWFLWWRNLL